MQPWPGTSIVYGREWYNEGGWTARHCRVSRWAPGASEHRGGAKVEEPCRLRRTAPRLSSPPPRTANWRLSRRSSMQRRRSTRSRRTVSRRSAMATQNAHPLEVVERSTTLVMRPRLHRQEGCCDRTGQEGWQHPDLHRLPNDHEPIIQGSGQRQHPYRFTPLHVVSETGVREAPGGIPPVHVCPPGPLSSPAPRPR